MIPQGIVYAMEIVIATWNAHKVDELRLLFPEHHLLLPSELGLSVHDIDERGSTYLENACIKAEAVFKLCKRPTLADDSGLSVAILNGAPGIKSARFGSEDGTTKLDATERNVLLLEHMKGQTDRRCAFICCLVLMYDTNRFVSVQETCPGLLTEHPRGLEGFGYDPVVYLPELGKTVAELTSEEKNQVSHRGRAAFRMNRILSVLELEK